MTSKQKPHALLSLYASLYEKRYGVKPSMNRHRDKWAFADMIEDLGETRAREVVEWYLQTGTTHTLRNLFRTYDMISREIDEHTEDRHNLSVIRQQTKQRVEEYRRAKLEQHRSEGNFGSSDTR